MISSEPQLKDLDKHFVIRMRAEHNIVKYATLATRILRDEKAEEIQLSAVGHVIMPLLQVSDFLSGFFNGALFKFTYFTFSRCDRCHQKRVQEGFQDLDESDLIQKAKLYERLDQHLCNDPNSPPLVVALNQRISFLDNLWDQDSAGYQKAKHAIEVPPLPFIQQIKMYLPIEVRSSFIPSTSFSSSSHSRDTPLESRPYHQNSNSHFSQRENYEQDQPSYTKHYPKQPHQSASYQDKEPSSFKTHQSSTHMNNSCKDCQQCQYQREQRPFNQFQQNKRLNYNRNYQKENYHRHENSYYSPSSKPYSEHQPQRYSHHPTQQEFITPNSKKSFIPDYEAQYSFIEQPKFQQQQQDQDQSYHNHKRFNNFNNGNSIDKRTSANYHENDRENKPYLENDKPYYAKRNYHTRYDEEDGGAKGYSNQRFNNSYQQKMNQWRETQEPFKARRYN